MCTQVQVQPVRINLARSNVKTTAEKFIYLLLASRSKAFDQFLYRNNLPLIIEERRGKKKKAVRVQSLLFNFETSLS